MCQVIILFISIVMLEYSRAQSKFIRHLSTGTFSSKNTGKASSVDQCAIISSKRSPRLVSDIFIINAPASLIFIMFRKLACRNENRFIFIWFHIHR